MDTSGITVGIKAYALIRQHFSTREIEINTDGKETIFGIELHKNNLRPEYEMSFNVRDRKHWLAIRRIEFIFMRNLK